MATGAARAGFRKAAGEVGAASGTAGGAARVVDVRGECDPCDFDALLPEDHPSAQRAHTSARPRPPQHHGSSPSKFAPENQGARASGEARLGSIPTPPRGL